MSCRSKLNLDSLLEDLILSLRTWEFREKCVTRGTAGTQRDNACLGSPPKMEPDCNSVSSQSKAQMHGSKTDAPALGGTVQSRAVLTAQFASGL